MDLAAAVALQGAAHKLDGRTEFQGLKISIENEVGSVRRGVNKKTGKAWETRMRYPYGYIRLTQGVDGDHVDCFLGPHKHARYAYVIHQNNPNTGKYDEDKVMLGFTSATAAKAAYNVHYDQPWKFYGSMDEVLMEDFIRKVLTTKDRPKVIKAQRLVLRAGGPGSGCHGENCGRPPKFQDVIDKKYLRAGEKAGYENVKQQFQNSTIEYKTVDSASIERQNTDLTQSAVARWEKKINDGKDIPAFVVAPKEHGGYFLLDGHHRLEALGKDQPVRIAVLQPKVGWHWTRHVSMRTREIWMDLEREEV
jgi:hypothetical protein